MAGLDAALVEILRSPQFVIESLSDQATALHYRYYVGTRVGDKGSASSSSMVDSTPSF